MAERISGTTVIREDGTYNNMVGRSSRRGDVRRTGGGCHQMVCTYLVRPPVEASCIEPLSSARAHHALYTHYRRRWC